MTVPRGTMVQFLLNKHTNPRTGCTLNIGMTARGSPVPAYLPCLTLARFHSSIPILHLSFNSVHVYAHTAEFGASVELGTMQSLSLSSFHSIHHHRCVRLSPL